jgi:AraC-like DNA-binding protein
MLTWQQLFRDKLIPWAEINLEQRLVVARPVMKRAHLPDGVELCQNKFIGKRVPVRNRRNAGYRLYYAEWPEDHLHELTAPKLICVTKGVTDYVAGKHIITCGEGHFILLPAFIPNVADGRPNLEGERRKNGYCELLQILVSRDSIGCMFSAQSGEEIRYTPEFSCVISHQPAVRLFNDFMEQAQTGENHTASLQQHLLAAFFWMIHNEINAGHEFYSIFQNRQAAQPWQTIDELRDYIKANLRHQLTIEKVARHLYMSPRQFTRYLRREAGESFVEILNECRLEESKRFLSETPWTIDGIAYMVGFKSSSYFNAFFSRHMGCSAGNYRKKTTKKFDLN